MSAPASLQLFAVPGLPLVRPGDDLVALVLQAMDRAGMGLHDGDAVIIAQKVVSKSEGRIVDLANIVPSPRAVTLAARLDKDPRLVEVILGESRRIVRAERGLLIVEHRLGLVMANAGVDQSNVGDPSAKELALLLPLDPDASALRLREDFQLQRGCRVAVIINDSFGRPWRVGTTGVAIGAAGFPALLDRRNEPDLFGRPLRVTMVAYADELAAAASLLMGQGDEARPVIVARGVEHRVPHLPARVLVRGPDEDLFR